MCPRILTPSVVFGAGPQGRGWVMGAPPQEWAPAALRGPLYVKTMCFPASAAHVLCPFLSRPSASAAGPLSKMPSPGARPSTLDLQLHKGEPRNSVHCRSPSVWRLWPQHRQTPSHKPQCRSPSPALSLRSALCACESAALDGSSILRCLCFCVLLP